MTARAARLSRLQSARCPLRPHSLDRDVSGILRGQVTVATTGNILLADDLTYVTSPGSIPDCDRNGKVNANILGLLTPQFFVLEDNNVNTPFRNGTTAYVKAFDETADETVHGAILTLNSVLREDIFNGPDNTETCAGGPIGRGCFKWGGRPYRVRMPAVWQAQEVGQPVGTRSGPMTAAMR
jgi:hypothetical protein